MIKPYTSENMKLKFIKQVIFAAALFSCAGKYAQAQTTGNFILHGTINNAQPMPAIIYCYENNKLIDSAIVQHGHYAFRGTLDEPKSLVLMDEKPKSGKEFYNMLSLYVNKGDLDVVSDNKLSNYTATGPGSAVDHDYKEAISKTLQMADSLRKVAAEPGFMDDQQKKASWRIAMSNMFEPMKDQLVNYLNAHPATPAGKIMMELIVGFPMSKTEEIERTFKKLPLSTQAAVKPKIDSILNDRKVKETEKAAREKMAAIGGMAANFTENTPEGKPVSLSSFRGKYVLVDFWASWCVPCRAENPNVLKAYARYKSKGLEILGVSLDGANSKAAWVKAIEKDQLTWTQVSDLKAFSGSAAKLYGVTFIPINYLINPEGVIVAKNLRGEDLDKKLAEIFK